MNLRPYLTPPYTEMQTRDPLPLVVCILCKDHYQAFWGVLIDLIVELLGLIIKPFDNQTES
jgi:hypothetical protein